MSQETAIHMEEANKVSSEFEPLSAPEFQTEPAVNRRRAAPRNMYLRKLLRTNVDPAMAGEELVVVRMGSVYRRKQNQQQRQDKKPFQLLDQNFINTFNFIIIVLLALLYLLLALQVERFRRIEDNEVIVFHHCFAVIPNGTLGNNATDGLHYN